jgi:hypothetical protein
LRKRPDRHLIELDTSIAVMASVHLAFRTACTSPPPRC